MSGPTELSIAAGVLIDSGLKATAVLGLGIVATRLARQASASTRHALWAITLGVLPGLPLLATQRGPDITIDAPWLVGAWALGALVAFLPLLCGLHGLRVLRSHSDPVSPGVFQSNRLTSPVTWGLMRPVIVLPSAAASWSCTHRTAALAHERAHISRGDWAVHVAAWAICAVFWFHPLAWWARRSLALEAEHAADDVVLAAGIRPSEYASLLLCLARLDPPRAALGAASSMVSKRVQAVLTPRVRSTRRWPTVLVAMAVFGLTVTTLANWPTWTTPEAELTCQPDPFE